jgi:hypothetical protein
VEVAVTREAQLHALWRASSLDGAARRALLGTKIANCPACSVDDIAALDDTQITAWLVSHGVEPPDPLALRLWFDAARLAPEGWTLAATIAEGMLHLSSGHVVEAWIDHKDGLDLVDWMIAPRSGRR